jgi:hypothetical protein
MNTSRLSFLRMIEADYIAYISVLAPVVMWGVYAFSYFSGREPGTTYTLSMAGITVAGMLALIWRYRLFSTIFEDGQQTQATISRVSFYRDRGRIDYEYTYMGQQYKSGNAVHKIRRVTDLKIGDQVTVMIDRNKPNRAFIKDLYLQANQ